MTRPIPTLSRASKRAYRKAIADAGERIVRLRGDPQAIEREARQRVFANLDRLAKTVWPGSRAKAARFVKRGVHRS